MALPFSSADMARQLGHGGNWEVELHYETIQIGTLPFKKIGTLQFKWSWILKFDMCVLNLNNFLIILQFILRLVKLYFMKSEVCPRRWALKLLMDSYPQYNQVCNWTKSEWHENFEDLDVHFDSYESWWE